jgi:sulfur carrier protein ThiS
MTIINGSFSGIRFASGTARASTNQWTSIRSLKRAAFQQRHDYHEMGRDLGDLSRKLELLHRASERYRLTSRRGGAAALPSEPSGRVLGLSTFDAISTLTGAAEINTATTSFSVRGPSWEGGEGSTAQVTVGGTYTGTVDDTLTFEVFRDRTIGGSRRVKIDVYDSADNHLERLTWNKGAPHGKVQTTSSGLEVSFGPGQLKKNDTFHVDVSAVIGTDIDPSRPLGGTRNDHPGLEDAHSVSSGSFMLNGESITVLASDSLADVLERVNHSSAGVTATLEDDVVTLTASVASGDSVTITNDTSGLIAALKLDSGLSSPGSRDERSAAMHEVAQFSQVADGDFSVNGVSVSVSDSDSLNDVLSRINDSGAGVSAALTDAGAVHITSNDDLPVTLSGDNSGFLSSVGISQGTYGDEDAETSTRRRGSRLAARKLVDAIVAIADPLNGLFLTRDDEGRSLDRITVQSKLKAAIKGAFFESELDVADNGTGLTFDLEQASGMEVLSLSVADRRTLQASMRSSPAEMSRFLFGSNQREGLLSRLTAAVDVAQEDVMEWTNGIGVGLSAYA